MSQAQTPTLPIACTQVSCQKGTFTAAINRMQWRKATQELHFTWSIRRNGLQKTQNYFLTPGDPFLVQSGFTVQKTDDATLKELAKLLILYIEADDVGKMTNFRLKDGRGYITHEPIVWE